MSIEWISRGTVEAGLDSFPRALRDVMDEPALRWRFEAVELDAITEVEVLFSAGDLAIVSVIRNGSASSWLRVLPSSIAAQAVAELLAVEPSDWMTDPPHQVVLDPVVLGRFIAGETLRPTSDAADATVAFLEPATVVQVFVDHGESPALELVRHSVHGWYGILRGAGDTHEKLAVALRTSSYEVWASIAALPLLQPAS